MENYFSDNYGQQEGSIFISIFSDSPNFDVNIAPRRNKKMY